MNGGGGGGGGLGFKSSYLEIRSRVKGLGFSKEPCSMGVFKTRYFQNTAWLARRAPDYSSNLCPPKI